MKEVSGGFRVRKGLRQNLPARAELAEPMFTFDTGELFIGRGDDKPPLKIGQSDYEVWLSQGNTGTIEDFYSSTSRQTWRQAEW